MNLNNKIVVITGGAGLLGAEFVRSVVCHGGVAIIADNNLDNANKIKNKLLKEGFSNCVQIQYLDITNKNSINNLIKSVNENYGKIDALVNNAYPRNTNYGMQFENVEFSDFCENISINLGGYFLTSQQFSKFFVQQGHGNIINISSVYGVVAPRFEIYKDTVMTTPVEYSAIKSALIHLTKYMAKYFNGKNIRFNSISLGGIKNNQPDSFVEKYNSYCLNKGMLEVKDISGTLIFLLSDYSKFINGENIIVDDGFTL
jgi:NAD(P)-dependent dehydrogenase (short-subunit alcohol dehydrogenase family)